jgi:hypothetical protein
MGVPQTVRIPYLDGLSFWRAPTLVYLFRLFQGGYCGRRVAVLYEGGLFACRRCCGLAYTTQQETPMYRGLAMAQKIRRRLGGSTDIFDVFPHKPKGMHWSTYDRLRLAHDAAKEHALEGVAGITERR